uniref:C4 n=1 Tax=Opuntia virus 2-DBG_56 TaxID=3033938 RepID=A0A8A9WQG0_9GEMI|nr:C4 [Opuntia virus 2-DBG_56]QTT61680.1 C4 [Opuntia virus 2-DBG_56]QTT61685.1 C4 [Opuntia virus 2-DBG_56]QTT61690.1 C4 [Opuntia virus 2-DBG_56]QTT61695.1 C4 [Opuntia virus 2-DBG_56]
MGNLISTSCFNSKGKSSAQITDYSTWFPQPGQHISIRTFRELNPAPMSSPTSTRMETHWNGENSRSTAEVLEEVNRQLMIHTQRH